MRKLLEILQKIGKSLILPISVLPAAGLLYRLGQNDLLQLPLMVAAGNAVFYNLPLIFAVGVATGFSGGKAEAALSAVLGQLVLQAVMNPGQLLPKGSVSDPQLGMGVFGGVIIGIVASILYDRFHDIKLPQVLGFFGGNRFVLISTAAAAFLIGNIGIMVWQPLQNGIDATAAWASQSIVGPAMYAGGKRALIPLGLHHIYYPAFLYQFGSFADGGVTYTGDTARYFHGDPTAGVFMASEYPILMFGLPGAAFAIFAAASRESRKKVGAVMLSAALVAFLTGITEPIEFAFMFAAPVLFILHVVFAFASGIITSLLHIRLGYTFSASFIDYILGYKFAEHPLYIWPVGFVFFLLYFCSFYLFIKRFNIKTMGREEKSSGNQQVEITASPREKAVGVIACLGGSENILELDACITRVRLIVKDPALVNKKGLKNLGAAGTIIAGNGVQVIFGTEADKIKEDMKAILDDSVISMEIEEKIEDAQTVSIVKHGKATRKCSMPIEGEVIPIEKVPDEVFASKALGDGFAVIPARNKVYAPLDGEVVLIFPTKHAFVMRSTDGLEILIHIGIDTVKMQGEGIDFIVKEGDKVAQGQLLLNFDLDKIAKGAKSVVSPVIITNMENVQSLKVKYGESKAGETIASIKIK